MDRLGVDISVVVAPPPRPFYGEANACVLEAVKKHPGRLAALFRANPHLEGEDERFRDAQVRGARRHVCPQVGYVAGSVYVGEAAGHKDRSVLGELVSLIKFSICLEPLCVYC